MSRKRAVVSGGSGYAGRFIVERLLGEGYAVAVLGRTRPPHGYFSQPVDFLPFELGTVPERDPFVGADAVVHAAFDHVPGRYRGGEGSDPVGFRRRNLDGTVALFGQARGAGIARAVFLSSRAVYGDQPTGQTVAETAPCRPDTLYGEVKLEAEQRLIAMRDDRFCPAVLRATGIYGPAGPGRRHKWDELFRDFASGLPIEPRVATEVHGDDVAAAVSLLLAHSPERVSGEVFNVSDLVLDRHDLLTVLRDEIGSAALPPPPADAGRLNVMATAKLEGLGWRPGGWPLLDRTVRNLARGLRIIPV